MNRDLSAPRLWLRWLPAAIVPAVIAVGVFAVPLQAGAAVDLPDKTPEQVLALVGESKVSALSGTIEQSSQLGLPDLSGLGAAGGEGAASALELLSGSHTARIFVDGPTKARVQVLDRLAERDLVRNGSDVWLYTSDDNSATHVALPESPDTTAVPEHSGDVPTPAEVADKLLGAIDPSTTVSVGTDGTVAGRTVYELVLTPRAADTLVGAVSIAVDSETGLPLSVSVDARGQEEAAFQVAFTEISLATPDAALFDFTPPAGATVTEQALPQRPDKSDAPKSDAPDSDPPVDGKLLEPTVLGSGWSTIVELPAGLAPAEMLESPLLGQIATETSGGRVLQSALITVLLTDDGRVLAGSVPLESLQAAANR